MERRSGIRRWVLPAAAIGFAVVMAATPVGAHVTDNTKHLGRHVWRDYVKAETLKLFYAKAQSDARFVNTSELWFAKVDADNTGATLLAGRGVQAVSRVNVGIFAVDFAGDVSACAWVASLQDNAGGLSVPGEISLELAAVETPDILWVRTYQSGGAAQDPADSDGFSIQVTC